ncbi:hypothetical protein P170DRAFT_351758 [Aspergillus steynii IBT 23096]|uniref:Mid2 domain-containing protein n=1 Tax=Aspergillus steynii IBT 23096 TaxID=1392250 RepID=A0A2I2GI10_9EURO|nr:uncharacterized protein P170DRAFT_351758 [Aspergillus steynii IBT 23096]PLB52511.1 hypothetical protein P170DRAFT_351758 [Aspergillus steynii IBT 23096]
MRGILPFLITQTALLSTAATASKCYFSDGSEASSEIQPCFPSKSTSACCSTNKSGTLPNDVCLHNGLCMAQVAQYSGLIFQNACTDKSWESPDCPSVCGMSLAQNTGIYVLPCPQRGVGYWCCSANGTECCDDAFRMNMGSLVIGEDTSSDSSTSAAGSETTAKATTTTTADVTTTATATSNPTSCALEDAGAECPKSNTTAVGAGLGISLGACLVGTVGALFFQRRAHQKKLREYSALHASQMVQLGHGGPSAHPTMQTMAELPLRPNKVYEIGDSRG